MSKFASGRKAFGFCDVCGFRTPLAKLRALVVKGRNTNTLACKECWSPDHPQLLLGMYPVSDPQALRNPRPDTSFVQGGNNSLGSRIIQWGWNPVGGAMFFSADLTPNPLVLTVALGDVTVEAI